MAKKNDFVSGLQVVKVRLVKEEPLFKNRMVKSPDDAVAVMSDELADYDREVFCVLNLKTDGSVINMNIVSMGTLNASSAAPREVFKSSILSNAAGVILIHNHPSGRTEPSQSDYTVTQRLYECGKILDIPVMDHIIVSGEHLSENYSFYEHGELGMSYSEIYGKQKKEKKGEAR